MTSWVAFAACCLVSALASADPAAQARFHDELARSHYKARRFEQALREFFLEQRISPNPRIAFNIALCFQDLKRNEEAFQYLGEYLASEDADPERRAYATRVVASLKDSLALVRVETTPPGAEIFVDRKELGNYGLTPKVVALTPGEHQLWIELDGYRSVTTTVVARRAEELRTELAPERIVGKLRVNSVAAGQITVRTSSGETVGRGAAPVELSLPPGSYEVSLVSPGHLPWTGLGRVEADQQALVTATPSVLPEPTGSITVTSNVPGALVELNGQPAGFSPTVLSNLKLGKQRMRVVAPNLLPWNGNVDVAAGERSWLTVSLEERPTQRVSPATWIAGGIGATALVTSGVLAIFAAQTHSEFEDTPPGADSNALRERGMTLNTAADIALVTGLVATVTATILYFTTSEVRGRPSAASMTRSKQ